MSVHLLVCSSVCKTPQHLEIIILHHSTFNLHHSTFNLHHSTFNLHHSSFILHLSFIILPSSFLHFATFKLSRLFGLSDPLASTLILYNIIQSIRKWLNLWDDEMFTRPNLYACYKIKEIMLLYEQFRETFIVGHTFIWSIAILLTSYWNNFKNDQFVDYSLLTRLSSLTWESYCQTAKTRVRKCQEWGWISIVIAIHYLKLHLQPRANSTAVLHDIANTNIVCTIFLDDPAKIWHFLAWEVDT